jgi:hypothetical protein
VLKGKSKAEIVAAIASALDKKGLPALEAGAMCYMMSKQQVLNDQRTLIWYFLSRARGESRGADLPSASIMAAGDPEERTTILMVWVGN